MDMNVTPVGISPYWLAVKDQVEQHKEKTMFITSTPSAINRHPGGAVCEAHTYNAAKHIVNGTHRKSTPEEIERFKKEQQDRAVLCMEMEAAQPTRENQQARQAAMKAVEMMRDYPQVAKQAKKEV